VLNIFKPTAMLVLDQMKVLVNLAQVDGKVADREKSYIVNIGRANGMYPDQILPLFDRDHELTIPSLNADEKFEFMYSLVQLMKIDERMYQEEIRYCSMVATRLGYDQQALFELMLQVKSSEMSPSEISELKKLISRYLIK
jgi:hypothetical protein